MKTALRLAGLAAAFVMAACDDSTPAPTPTPTPTSVPAADMATMPNPNPNPNPTSPMTAAVTVGPGTALAFAPQNVDIAAGGTVTWTWGGTLAHSVTSDTGLFDSGVKMTGTFSFRFVTAGTYNYFCTVHGRNIMFGSVIVH